VSILNLKEKSSLEYKDLLQMVLCTVSGMEYLESNQVLHRDLGKVISRIISPIACRNLLAAIVDSEFVVKVSDFGLSRDSSIYTISNSKVPIRWTGNR
jgi:serine/threonine protein kinase